LSDGRHGDGRKGKILAGTNTQELSGSLALNPEKVAFHSPGSPRQRRTLGSCFIVRAPNWDNGHDAGQIAANPNCLTKVLFLKLWILRKELLSIRAITRNLGSGGDLAYASAAPGHSRPYRPAL
jgi:hypothetical protein